MSRPSTGNGSTARPTHIALPSNSGNYTPAGSPLPTPTPAFGGAVSPASPRHSFLGFIRTRSRAATMSNQAPPSPSLERGNPLAAPQSRGGSSREGSNGPTSRESSGVTRSISTPLSGSLTVGSTGASNVDTHATAARPSVTPTAPIAPSDPDAPKTYRIGLVPHLESQRSIAFEPVVRALLPIVVPPGVLPNVAAQSVSAVGPTVNGKPPALLLKIGRFTEKNAPAPATGQPGSASVAGALTAGSSSAANGSAANGGSGVVFAGGGGEITSSKVAFKSKVVSRSHAEIWCEPGGKFYIRDTKSSSGTFLNHIRLSSPNTDSRPTMLNDGDVLQLGVDYQGGVEDMFRCVKMRVEIGREWQRGANQFNTNALKQLKALSGGTETKSKSSTETKSKSATESTPSKKAKANVTDCCICLFSVTVCQSLFIAPCSHVFHYKCIRPLLLQHHPGFCCPLCRTFANLEEDVETEDAWEIASRRASIISRKPSNHSIRLPSSQPDPSPSSPAAGPSGQPSSGIGLGVRGASASVDELLAPGSTEDSTEGESEGMVGSSALARQTTAVGSPPVFGHDGDYELGYQVPPAVQEEEEPPSPNGRVEHRGSVTIPMAGLALTDEPMTNGNGHLDAATPMNEHFLSTLAGVGAVSSQGIDQRLALAEELSASGTSAEGDEEGVPGGNREGQGRVDARTRSGHAPTMFG